MISKKTFGLIGTQTFIGSQTSTTNVVALLTLYIPDAANEPFLFYLFLSDEVIDDTAEEF